MNSLQKAQEHIDDLHLSIYELIPQYVHTEEYVNFLQCNLIKFEMRVVNDGVDLDDKEFLVTLPISIISKEFKTPFDYLTNYVHLMLHRLFNRPNYFWNKTKAPRNIFPEQSLGLIEDIYIQRLLRIIAPELPNRFYQISLEYGKDLNYTYPEIRDYFHTLLIKDIDKRIPLQIRAIHNFLENNDPLKQETFDLYIRYWYGVLTIPEIADMVKKYDM